jgi:ATP citrate (pro-S)-lyase
MSAKAIREATGKELINKYLEGGSELGVAKSRFASVNESTEWNQLLADNPWLETTVSTNGAKLNEALSVSNTCGS